MGVHADQAGAFAERVEEGGDLRPAERAGPVMILPADDGAAERPFRRGMPRPRLCRVGERTPVAVKDLGRGARLDAA